MKIIKQLLEHNLIAIAIVFTVVVAFLSLVSLNNIPNVEVPGKDKTIHFLFYFVLTLLWNVALQKKYKNWRLKYRIVFVVIIYGIIIEVLQKVLTKNRQPDIYDVMANTAGAFIALGFVFWLKNKTFQKKF